MIKRLLIILALLALAFFLLYLDVTRAQIYKGDPPTPKTYAGQPIAQEKKPTVEWRGAVVTPTLVIDTRYDDLVARLVALEKELTKVRQLAEAAHNRIPCTEQFGCAPVAESHRWASDVLNCTMRSFFTCKVDIFGTGVMSQAFRWVSYDCDPPLKEKPCELSDEERKAGIACFSSSIGITSRKNCKLAVLDWCLLHDGETRVLRSTEKKP